MAARVMPVPNSGAHYWQCRTVTVVAVAVAAVVVAVAVVVVLVTLLQHCGLHRLDKQC